MDVRGGATRRRRLSLIARANTTLHPARPHQVAFGAFEICRAAWGQREKKVTPDGFSRLDAVHDSPLMICFRTTGTWWCLDQSKTVIWMDLPCPKELLRNVFNLKGSSIIVPCLVCFSCAAMVLTEEKCPLIVPVDHFIMQKKVLLL